MKKMIALVLVFFACQAMGAVPLPKTPAGTALKDWLGAYDAGDAGKLASFKARYKRHWAVQDMLDSRHRTGGYSVLRVEKSSPASLTVLIGENESDVVHRLHVSMGKAGHGDALTMSIEHDVKRPPDLQIPRLSQAGAIRALSRRTAALADADEFSGAILVARDGKVLYEHAWGQADRASGTANTLHTKFRIGSMNKMFTAVGIFQLAEKGKLSLDAPFGTYLTDYPNKRVASRVTIRELLNHTGGTGDIFGPAFDANRDKLRGNDDYIDLYGKRGLDHPPGKSFEYSNFGFVILGAVIERVSHMSYYDYVQRHIFQPAKMTSTGTLPEAVHVPGRSTGYMWRHGTWVSNTDTLPYRSTAAGGGYSTIGDIFRFVRALQAGRLISKKDLGEATTAVFRDDATGYGYGYGFEVLHEGGVKSYGHEGGAPGMNGELRVFPAQGYVIVALSNLDPPSAHRLVDYFSLRMPENR